MTIDQSFYIGYISKTRGLKGEVQLFFEFEEYESLNIDVVFVEVNKNLFLILLIPLNFKKIVQPM